jgi:hypothetical protein
MQLAHAHSAGETRWTAFRRSEAPVKRVGRPYHVDAPPNPGSFAFNRRAAVLTVAIMLAFELVKQALAPHIGLWQSHAATIVFMTALALVAIVGARNRRSAISAAGP